MFALPLYSVLFRSYVSTKSCLHVIYDNKYKINNFFQYTSIALNLQLNNIALKNLQLSAFSALFNKKRFVLEIYIKYVLPNEITFI